MKRSILIALAILCVLVVMLGMWPIFLDVFGMPIRARAKNCDDLAGLPEIAEIKRRLSYFPHVAKNIQLRCTHYRGNIDGEFDITEAEFLDWAHTMDWKPTEISPSHVVSMLDLEQPDDGNVHYITIENGYYYHPDIVGHSFELAYDRTRKRAYFADSGHHPGPPKGK